MPEQEPTHEELVAKYSARREDLSPEAQAAQRYAAAQRAAGHLAPPPNPTRQDDFLVGLGDDGQRFPISPHHDDHAGVSDEHREEQER